MNKSFFRTPDFGTPTQRNRCFPGTFFPGGVGILKRPMIFDSLACKVRQPHTRGGCAGFGSPGVRPSMFLLGGPAGSWATRHRAPLAPSTSPHVYSTFCARQKNCAAVVSKLKNIYFRLHFFSTPPVLKNLNPVPSVISSPIFPHLVCLFSSGCPPPVCLSYASL